MENMRHWSIQLHHKEERAIQGERKKEAFLGGGRGNASKGEKLDAYAMI